MKGRHEVFLCSLVCRATIESNCLLGFKTSIQIAIFVDMDILAFISISIFIISFCFIFRNYLYTTNIIGKTSVHPFKTK